MPKTKKASKKNATAVGGHKGAVQEQVLDEPSRVGSSVGHNEKHTHEVDNGARRYASITGDVTPPRQEIGNEKV
jgi:ATP-binding cassette subfamily G (WHITE) protein 2 (PDR)